MSWEIAASRHGADGRSGYHEGAGELNTRSRIPRPRFGDLLPLPLPVLESNMFEKSGARRVLQRVGRRHALHVREVEAIRALKELGGFGDEAAWPTGVQNRAQAHSL